MSVFYKIWAFFAYERWKFWAPPPNIRWMPLHKKETLVPVRVNNSYALRIYFQRSPHKKTLMAEFDGGKSVPFSQFSGYHDVRYLNMDLSALDEKDDLEWLQKLNGVRTDVLNIRLMRPVSTKCFLETNLALVEKFIETLDTLCVVIETDISQVERLRAAILSSETIRESPFLIIRLLSKSSSKNQFMHLGGMKYYLTAAAKAIDFLDLEEPCCENNCDHNHLPMRKMPNELLNMFNAIDKRDISMPHFLTPKTICFVECHAASVDMKAKMKDVTNRFALPPSIRSQWYFDFVSKICCAARDPFIDAAWKRGFKSCS